MNACKEYESLIVDVASGAAGEGDRSRLLEHTVNCEACSEAFSDLTQMIGATSIKSDPGDAFWNDYYGRLNERIESGQLAKTSAFQVMHLVNSVPRWSLQIAAAVVLIVSGILIGRNTQPAELAGEQMASVDAAQLELQDRAYTYLDRSKTLLLGVVNFNVDEDDPAMLNIDRRRQMAGSLIQEASLLRADLSDADLERLSQLIADLEIILLQIANIESNYDIPEIEMVQSGVDRKDIMFKIDVEAMSRFNNTNPIQDELKKAPATGAASSAV